MKVHLVSEILKHRFVAHCTLQCLTSILYHKHKYKNKSQMCWLSTNVDEYVLLVQLFGSEGLLALVFLALVFAHILHIF